MLVPTKPSSHLEYLISNINMNSAENPPLTLRAHRIYLTLPELTRASQELACFCLHPSCSLLHALQPVTLNVFAVLWPLCLCSSVLCFPCSPRGLPCLLLAPPQSSMSDFSLRYLVALFILIQTVHQSAPHKIMYSLYLFYLFLY